MRFQIRGLGKGSTNAQDGISVCQVADGALAEVSSMLHRMKELAVQASNDTNTKFDREAIQAELEQLVTEIDRIGTDTEFNTMPVFQGSDQVVLNPDGTPLIESEIMVDQLTLSDVSLGINPFTAGSSGDTLALKAIVSDSNSAAYGKNYNFIFGSGSTSSSSIRVNYEVDGVAKSNIIGMRDMTPQNFQYDESLSKWSRDFVYTNGDGVEILLTQTVTANEGAKRYEISYDVTNNSTLDVDFDLLFHSDTAYNNNDICEGYFINSDRVDKFCIYSKDDSKFADPNYSTTDNIINGIPDSFSIVDMENSLSFSEKITFNGGDANPDSFSIGHYSRIDEWPYYDSAETNSQLGANAIRRDLGFSLLWNDTLTTGQTQQYSFNYGIEEVDTDDNLTNVTITPSSNPTTIHTGDNTLWIQTGALEGSGLNITIGEMDAEVLGIKGIDVTTFSNAQRAIDKADKALITVAKQRSVIGAQQNRLEYAKSIADNIRENTQASESRIRDLDMAKEMVDNSKYSILQQSGQAMLAQANQLPQGILSLLDM